MPHPITTSGSLRIRPAESATADQLSWSVSYAIVASELVAE